ncbi:MAG: ribonucleoside-diphosphate reductase alpha chain, partial [Thermoanaerobaculia bacterium]|nr:ribonucleoside-diphosphate reductase alpha chain [Thermoanaerobaculia bacterium]
MTSIEIPTSSIRPRSNGKPVRKKETKLGGIEIGRFFTKPGVDVYDTCEWEMRSAAITSESGGIVFEQKDVEMPKFWSQMATNVVVSKYFRGHIGSPERETSVRQLIGRVVRTITGWGREGGYFATEADGDTFRDELTHILLYQMAAFNSPVWFNVGIEPHPQCSACFINSVNDTMDSILGLAKTEGMLFKYGSGTGSNLSSIRSSKELLAGGGTASGPVSFMKGYDSFAGVIKSGGKTRRAAKMVILNADHPDIVEFIESKEKEEKKAWALIDAGYDGAFNAVGGAYDSVQFQNANHSVRVTDDFMHAYEKDLDWQTWTVTEPKQVMGTFKARELMRKMAESAHLCGDPGMQFDTTVNDWHPCPNTARINASNPCSEYMFLDDSACNLASLNLMRFYNENTGFDVEAYRAALRIVITAQEITVDYASYPTKAIEKNSHAFRPLGIGYANLGALLMARGIAYDSEDGRDYAAAITSILSGESYAQSARIASKVGPFEGYAV